MLKFQTSRLAFWLFLLGIVILFGVSWSTSADNSFPWLNSTLYLHKVADVAPADIPSTLFSGGNSDCTSVDGNYCSTDTPYGSVWNSSAWLDGQWRPIRDFGGNSSNFFAIPNSDIGITTSSTPVFGSYVYLTDNVSLSLTPHYAIGSPDLGAGLSYFQLNRLYDRKLADKSGHPLAADLGSMAFSGNSRWMAVTDPNIANLRVNIATGEVLPFGRTFTYGYGQNPRPKNAISSAGRYALEASEDSSVFMIFDLSTCTAPSAVISRPADCTGRNLLSDGYLTSRIPGYSGTLYARFINDETLGFYAGYKVGNTTKYAYYTLSTNMESTSQLEYLAIGDSFISGEGAFSYQAGTDTNTNHCHASLASYPYLLGRDLSLNSYHSVACSGAVTANISDKSLDYAADNNHLVQAKGKNTEQYDDEIYREFLPGYRAQIHFVEQYHPETATISIGGNDMGFSKILLRCLEADTCYSSYEDRVEVVRQINYVVFPRLVSTYRQLKNASPLTRIYVIGYPQIIKPDALCGDNVHLNDHESRFAELLIDYLDQVIEAAADRAGVRYVDVQHALDGYRLCEGQAGSIAMNGITAGNDRVLNTVGAESYHPNAYGHALLEQAILNQTNGLTQPMPSPDPASAVPQENSLLILDAMHTNRVINQLNYNDELTDDVVYRGGVWDVTVDGVSYGILKPISKVKAELHSDVIQLGEFNTDQIGVLKAQITSTANVPVGFHALHVYGTDVANNPVDIYKVVYVADSPESLNPTAENPCVVVPASGNDYDQDGIDDACDGNIGWPPAINDTAGEAQASTLTNSSVNKADSANDGSPTAVADPQNQTGSDGISLADSPQNRTEPAVLAASTTKPAASPGSNTSTSFKHSIYRLTAFGLFGLAGLVFAAKRWMF